jgi:hypothetical protein
MPVTVDPQILAAYAGRYQLPDGSVVTIRVDGTRIFIRGPNKPEDEFYELYALSENQFVPLVFEAVITFYTNDNGEVDRLVVVQKQPSLTLEAKKVP